MGYEVYWNTEKSIDIRHKNNEDSLMFSEYSFMGDEPIKTIVIADGVGAYKNGKTASDNAVTGFLEALYSEIFKIYQKSSTEGYSLRYYIQDVKEAMKDAIIKANGKVCAGVGQYEKTGTTISAVCVIDDCAVIANVGDSPVYYYNSRRQKLVLVSELQTLAEKNVENGIYARYSPDYYDDEHRIYHYLGESLELDPCDIFMRTIGNLTEGDIILSGTDGAFSYMKNSEIQNLIYNMIKTPKAVGKNDGYINSKGCIEDNSLDGAGFLEELFRRASEYKFDDQTAILYVLTNG